MTAGGKFATTTFEDAWETRARLERLDGLEAAGVKIPGPRVSVAGFWVSAEADAFQAGKAADGRTAARMTCGAGSWHVVAWDDPAGPYVGLMSALDAAATRFFARVADAPRSREGGFR
jgi:hypothetical protein